jgi:hypothetical protein
LSSEYEVNRFDTPTRYLRMTVSGAAVYIGPWVSILEIRAFDTIDPDAPRGLAAVVDSRDVQLTWSANADANLAGYRVYPAFLTKMAAKPRKARTRSAGTGRRSPECKTSRPSQSLFCSLCHGLWASGTKGR